VARELLLGLAERGHHIDCFFPSPGHPLPPQISAHENLRFIWGTSAWKWNRWYSRTRLGAFVSGLIARARASVRLRAQIVSHHRSHPYDVIYQFSSIETPAVPVGLTRTVPLVIHPETHIAGELRWLIAERQLGLRCQPAYMLPAVATVMAARALVQRVAIGRASLVVCISAVFRDHLIRDYGVRPERTVVIPNAIRIDRFTPASGPPADPPRILVLGRISVRKGVETVVAVARALERRGVPVRIRIVGAPSLWSDYTKLLEDLPSENSEYVGHLPPSEVPAELARSDILVQASKYEPFALTVAEALATGVPVVATTEVGAREGVDETVLSQVQPGDVQAMTSAITEMIERRRTDPQAICAKARSEAERLFASERVCEQISLALGALVDGLPDRPGSAAARPGGSLTPPVGSFWSSVRR